MQDTERPRPTPEPIQAPVVIPQGPAVEIADTDPLHAHLINAGGPIDLTHLELDSPALGQLRQDGTVMVVPLISQGELLGTLNLGPRLSDQPYSSDDRKLLANLASQVAPAVKVAQLVRQQEAQAQERERIEQELRVAALIQQTLLPKDLPRLDGWEIDAYYRPARAVGGDFYDFIPLSRGRIGLVIGDVTDKGVPAALVMATTRSTLRAAASHSDDPGLVLAETNEVLHGEIPSNMFVTCLYGVLEPATGRLTFANAGHNLPYVRTPHGVEELRATGMPLGLMPGMHYEVVKAELNPGETMLLSSDGIVEAHATDGSMFGFPRLMGLVGSHSVADRLISTVLAELDRFTGPGHEQEDDVTMVIVRRTSSAAHSADVFATGTVDSQPDPAVGDLSEGELSEGELSKGLSEGELSEIDRFELASDEGNERVAMERVAGSAVASGLNGERLERLKTAVAEATMNAIEHGNRFDPARKVDIAVLASRRRLVVQIRDQGTGPDLPEPEQPDLLAKLTGDQSPRGWGLFLIREMVDDLRTVTTDGLHVVELEMNLTGEE